MAKTFDFLANSSKMDMEKFLGARKAIYK